MRKHARGLCGIIWSEPEKKLKSDEKGRVSYTAIMHYGCVVGVADSVSNKNTTEDKSKQNGAGRPAIRTLVVVSDKFDATSRAGITG